MITGGLLVIAAYIMRWFASLLPVGHLVLDVSEDVSTFIAQKMGPADGFIPIHEGFEALVIVLSTWLPAAMVFTVVEWCYRHMPFLGKG